VALLSAERSLLAGLHTAQGRVIAILRLVQWAPQEVLALLPRELARVVLERLQRFVLRAKVRLADATPQWQILGLIGAQGPAPAGLRLPSLAGASLHDAERLWVCIAETPARWLGLVPAGTPLPSGFLSAQPDEWIRLDVASGMPQVYAQTSELFVAQMLNLDVLDAISFSKGCYTGQEVIARTHYRGRVKRRMQRFRTSGSGLLQRGESRRLSDGRGVRVVEAAPLEDGRCEFLAVAPLAVARSDAGDGSEADDGSAAALIVAEPMPLPYALPA
jgi:folate-binding protein YgfZ